jgi:hypothetical protein
MKTISFGSVKNIGKKEKYYFKKLSLYYKKFPSFHNKTVYNRQYFICTNAITIIGKGPL